MLNNNLNNIVTSIDLGSNSFRVLKFDCKLKKSLAEFDTTVGTADGLSQSGNISKEALSRIISAIKKSIEIIGYNPKEAVAVTTQALRIANNSKEILEEIRTQTGIDFKVIDGKREGELSLLSMQNALKREHLIGDDFVLVDIGGGSTELIIYQNGNSHIKSFAFGIVTLSQSLNQEKDLEIFRNEILDFVKTSQYDISKSIFVSTAGTPTIIAALKHGLDNVDYDKHIINGTTLTLKEVCDIQNKLQSISKDELITKVGTGREDFINTGMLIYRLFFKTLNKELSIVFDDGLREGVALDACQKIISIT
jgi:exopolyphosphatase/guanosine-5'-triphosphate,3'-diphosphate pyrophosphatase